MGFNSRTKADFFLFLLLHISLLLHVRGETTSSDVTPTNMGTDTMVTGESTPTATSLQATTNSGQTPTSISLPPATSRSTSLVNVTMNTTVLSTEGSSTAGPNTTNSKLLSCRVLSCNCTACYSTFMNTNGTLCSASDKYCELRKYGNMVYSVRCAASCSAYCTNTTQENCSVECCSSETCLSSTLASMVNSSMSMSTTMASTATTTKATTVVSTTPVNNGKKCHKITCNGDLCYQGNTNVVLCATQNYCMLKKTTSGTIVTWTAGCSDDCTKETVCSSSTTNCFLECCNATTASSCLKLTGVVNMPNSATNRPFSPMLLIVSSLMLWLLSVVTSP